MKLNPPQREALKEFEEALRKEQQLAQEKDVVGRHLGALLLRLSKLGVPSVAVATAFARTRSDSSPALRRRLQGLIRTRRWRERKRKRDAGSPP